MTITVERDALLEAVSFTERRAKNKVIPILGNLLFRTKVNSLSIVGCDMASSSEIEMAAECKADIAFTVPARNMAALLSGSRKGATVTFKPESSQVHVKFGKSNYRLPTLLAADFPPALMVPATNAIPVSASDINRMFGPCTKLVDETNPTPFYTGIFLHFADDRLATASGDGHSFLRICAEADAPAAHSQPGIIIPKAAAEEILKLGGESGGFLAWNDRLLSITANGCTFATKLIDAQFPDYTRIITPNDGPFLEFDRDEMLEALKRLTSLSDKGIMTMEWADRPTAMHLAFQANGEGQEEIECSPSEMGAAMTGVPPWQLLRLLECLDVDCVRFHIDDPMKPFRISTPSRPDILAMQVPCLVFRQQAAA